MRTSGNFKQYWLTGSLILTCMLAVPAFADLTISSTGNGANATTGLTIKGSARVRFEGDERTSDLRTSRNFATIRVRPEAMFSPANSNTDVVFVPQFSRVFGEPQTALSGGQTNAGTSSAGSFWNPSSPSSGGLQDPVMYLHQAYIHYHPAPWWSLVAGRQVLSYGDELILGAYDWNTVGRSFDGFRTRFSYSAGFTDLFSMKVLQGSLFTAGPNLGNSAGTIQSGAHDLHGLYQEFNVGSWMRNLDFYTLFDRNASGPNLLWTTAVGLRMASVISWFDYRLEGINEWGSAVRNSAGAASVDGEIGFTFTDSWRPRLALEASIAGPNYNQLYPNAHRFLGYADILGRRNLTSVALHFGSDITDRLAFRFDQHMFWRADTGAPVYNTLGTAMGSGTATADNYVGSETDLTAKISFSRATSLAWGMSYFWVGSYLNNQAAYQDIKPHFYFAQMEVKF